MSGPAVRPYGRHPAQVTADRLADAIAQWRGRFEDYELEAIDVVRCALDRIAEPPPPPEPAKCGTDSGYAKHLRSGEPTCDECRAAHSAAIQAYRRGVRKRSTIGARRQTVSTGHDAPVTG